MLKTTMLVAGLAAGSAALTPKGCDGTFTGTKPEALSTVDCTLALTNDANCVETRPASADQTVFGGRVYCSAHQDPNGVADADKCFEYKVNAGGCGLITDAQWTAFGCTGTSPTPGSLGGDAQNPLLSCTPDVNNGYASFTATDSDGVRSDWGSAAVNMKCGSDGNWEFVTGKGVSKEGMCAHVTGGAYTNTANVANYRFSSATTVLGTTGLFGSGCTEETHTNCKGFSIADFIVYPDSKGDKVCGNNGDATTQNVFAGDACATAHKRDGDKAFSGAITCQVGTGGAKGTFTTPDGMCSYPTRSTTTIFHATDYLPADDESTDVGETCGYISCGSLDSHLGTAGAPALIKYGIRCVGETTTDEGLRKGWIPKTGDDMICVSESTAKAGKYTCGGSGALTASDVTFAGTICSEDNPDMYVGGTADTNLVEGTEAWTPTAIYRRPYLDQDYTLDITEMGLANGGLRPADTTINGNEYVLTQKRLNCKCDASATSPTPGRYLCTVVSGCTATAANKEIATEPGYPIKSTSIVPAKFHEEEFSFTATGYEDGIAECDQGTWVYKSGGGKKCEAKVNPPAADTKAVEQELGFVYSDCSINARSYCKNKVADANEGRTTCTKYTNWNAGFVMCDGATGTWKNQSDYSRCLSATDAESEAMNYASATFTTLDDEPYPARPGSTAAVTCKDGLTGKEVVDANGEMVNIQKGSGKCNTDGSGSVEWTPCLMSCNSTLVAEDLNSTSVGIDIAQTDCSGLKVWNNQTERTWEFDCATQAADTYTGGRVYCNGITGKHEADDAEEKMCDAPAPGIVGALCATLYSTSENADKAAVNSAEKACETLGLWGAADTIDETSEAYLVKYDCGTGVKNDDACTFEANTTGYDVSSTCCTTTACQANADCYQMTADTEKGCWNFEVVDNSASIMGAGVVTLLALFHL